MKSVHVAGLASVWTGPKLRIGPRIPEHVRSTHDAEGAVVLDILQGQVFRLNFVGSKILELINQGLAESAISEQLAHTFEIDRATAEADLRQFVGTLEKHKLLIPARELE